MKIRREVEVPVEDLTKEDLDQLNRDKLLEVIFELQDKVNHT